MADILITGAAGFIGSHTADQLLAAGHSVCGVDNFRTGRLGNLTAALTSPRFTFRELDIVVPRALATLVAEIKPTTIIHLAALASVQESLNNPDLNYSLNVHATHLVVETARRSGVRRIVFASSAAVYGHATDLPIYESTEKIPLSPYGAAKFVSETILLGHATSFGLTVCCLRYFNVFGPRQDPTSSYSGVITIFDRRYRESKGVTIFGDGQQTRDFISVHDVARVNMLAATASNTASTVANICTGRGTSLLEIARVFGRHYPLAPTPVHCAPQSGDVLRSVGCPDLAAETLGFRARVSLEVGLDELINRG